MKLNIKTLILLVATSAVMSACGNTESNKDEDNHDGHEHHDDHDDHDDKEGHKH